MSEIVYLKTACEHCSGHIEYPSELTGQSIECPHCHQATPLPPPLPPSLTPSPPSPIPPPLPRQQAELHPIKIGGRTIVLPVPDNGCQRCDHLGKPPLVPFSFRQRLLVFFIAGDATPTQARYFYVQCARFFAGINETRETYEKLQAAIVRHDQSKARIFDVTEDSVCFWDFYAPINMIFTCCMMLVAGRVLHLYGMCHSELTSIEREHMVMKSWRDRIIKANPDDKVSGHEVIGDSCMSECEEIATTINRLVKAGYIPRAQELLESSLNDYFVLQLAMFADKNVNAYITIAAWKQAGLRLPAEDTAEFYPYGDSPSIAEEQSKAEAPTSKPQQRASETSDVPQEELDREVGIKQDELLGLFEISSQIHDGINQWLNPRSGVIPKSGIEIVDNLIAQLPKLSSAFTALHNRIQEIWDIAGFDYEITSRAGAIPDDEIRVKCGDLLSLAKARYQISNELHQWVHPESLVLKEGEDTLGHLIDRLDAFEPALRSMTATLDGIRERNF